MAPLTNVNALDFPEEGCATKQEYTMGAVVEKKTFTTAVLQKSPIADNIEGKM